MTFWYLPRSIDTFFLVVYEPHRALEGLQVVIFHPVVVIGLGYDLLFEFLLGNCVRG